MSVATDRPLTAAELVSWLSWLLARTGLAAETGDEWLTATLRRINRWCKLSDGVAWYRSPGSEIITGVRYGGSTATIKVDVGESPPASMPAEPRSVLVAWYEGRSLAPDEFDAT